MGALMTTGKSYYEHLGFHYRSEIERKNFQKVEIDAILLFSCLSKRMEDPMQVGRHSFVFDVHLKRGLLALAAVRENVLFHEISSQMSARADGRRYLRIQQTRQNELSLTYGCQPENCAERNAYIII